MISLIIPSFNQSQSLPPLIRDIFEQAGKARLEMELVVVDDNSTDGTGELVYYLKRFFPRLKTFHRTQKLGQTSAILQGIDQSEGQIIGVLDANYSHPPHLMPDLVRPIIAGHADITVASRYVEPRPIKNSHLIRNIVSQLARLLTRPLTGVSDPLSNYFFCRRKLLYDFEVHDDSPKLLLDLLTKSNYMAALEIPYDFVHPPHRNVVKWDQIMPFSKQLWRLYKHHRQS